MGTRVRAHILKQCCISLSMQQVDNGSHVKQESKTTETRELI
jgi:hypothetical protein